MKRHSLALAALVAALALTGCTENSPVNSGEIGSFSKTDSSAVTGSTSNKPDSTLNEPSSTSTNKPSSTSTNNPNSTSTNYASGTSTDNPSSTPNEPVSNIPGSITPPVDNPPAQEDDPTMKYPHISASELKAAIEKFPLDTITLPDGSNVSKYEAISAEADDLFFDFAFFRYASPIYKTTLDDPGLIRYTNGFWEPAVDIDSLEKEINTSYKKASKGDVLENGLSVKGAVCRINNRGEIVLSDLHFDGSVTVSGVINYLPEERMYTSAGTLYFRPDATKALIPILYSSRDMVFHYWDGYGNGEDDPPFFMYFDGVALVLGSINDSKYAKYDLKNAFGDKTTIPAKITVGNIKYGSLGGKRGEIIDIQF